MSNILEEKEEIITKLNTKIKCFEILKFPKTSSFLELRLSFLTQGQDKNISIDEKLVCITKCLIKHTNFLKNNKQSVNQEAITSYYNGYMMEKKKDIKEAIRHYRRALIIEPYFYEVYQRLFIDKLIKKEEGNEILNEMTFQNCDTWLKLIYYCRFNQVK